MKMGNMHGRYLCFLNALYEIADKKTPTLTSNLTKANNVSAYAFKAAKDLGLVATAPVKDKRTICVSWKAGTPPNGTDADKLIARVREINKEKTLAKPKKKIVKAKSTGIAVMVQRYAEVTINSTKVRVPIINNTVQLEVGSSKIVIEMS